MDDTAVKERWLEYKGNPILGGKLGKCFDVAVIKENDKYRMWFSWRSQRNIALTESNDGIQWDEPRIVLRAVPGSIWEGDEVNRPSVIKRNGLYQMWYTGQMCPEIDGGASAIGFAISDDGVTWNRVSGDPVLAPEKPWEKEALMSPHVMWDERTKIYRMWYCGGGHVEPDGIGYAQSVDGLQWEKHRNNPVFLPDPGGGWDNYKVGGPYVVYRDHWYWMFYIGYVNLDGYMLRSSIGIARSPDGIAHWERTKSPVIEPVPGSWTAYSCYKPCVLFDDGKWHMWFNGGSGPDEWIEQIGYAWCDGNLSDFFGRNGNESI